MNNTYEIILYVILAILFISRGIEQGILFSGKMTLAFKWNEHFPIVVSRVATIAGMGICLLIELWSGVFTILAFIPSFWFWRDSAYYWSRHNIDEKVYPDWFTAESTTSSSVTIKAMTFEWRITLLAISVIGLIINIIY